MIFDSGYCLNALELICDMHNFSEHKLVKFCGTVRKTQAHSQKQYYEPVLWF